MPGRSIRVRLLTVAAALLVCFAVPVRASALGPAGVPEDHELITLAQGVLAEIGQIRYDREPLAEELDAVARDRAKLDTKRLRARYFELLKEIYAGFGPERNALHRLAQLLPALEERIQRREEEAGTPEPGEEAVYAAQHVPVMRRLVAEGRKIIPGADPENPEIAFWRTREGDPPAATPAGGPRGGLFDEGDEAAEAADEESLFATEPPFPFPEAEEPESDAPAGWTTPKEEVEDLTRRRAGLAAAYHELLDQALTGDQAVPVDELRAAADQLDLANAELAQLTDRLVEYSRDHVAELDRLRLAILDAEAAPANERLAAAAAHAASTIDSALELAVLYTEAAALATGSPFLANQTEVLRGLKGTLRPGASDPDELDVTADERLLDQVEERLGALNRARDERVRIEAELSGSGAGQAGPRDSLRVAVVSERLLRSDVTGLLGTLGERARAWARLAAELATQDRADAEVRADKARAWGEQLAEQVEAFRAALADIPPPPLDVPSPPRRAANPDEERDPPVDPRAAATLDRIGQRDYLIQVAGLSEEEVDAMGDDELARRVFEVQTGGARPASLADVAGLLLRDQHLRGQDRSGPLAPRLGATIPPRGPASPAAAPAPGADLDQTVRSRIRRLRAEARLERMRLSALRRDPTATPQHAALVQAQLDARQRKLDAEVGAVVGAAGAAVQGIDKARFRARKAASHPQYPAAAPVLADATAQVAGNLEAATKLVRLAADVSGSRYLRNQAELLKGQEIIPESGLPGLWDDPDGDPDAGAVPNVPIPPPPPAGGQGSLMPRVGFIAPAIEITPATPPVAAPAPAPAPSSLKELLDPGASGPRGS